MAKRTLTLDDGNDDALLIEGAQFEDVTALASDQSQQETEILTELGQPPGDVEWSIKVYRVPSTGKGLIDLFDVPGDQVATIKERVRQEYGNGRYTTRVFKNGKLHRAMRFEIELPKSAPPQQQVPVADSALAAAVQQQGAILQALVQQLAQIKQAPPAPAQALDLNGIAALIAAVGTIAKSSSQPIPVAPAQNPIAMMTEVFRMVNDLQSEGKEKSVWDVVQGFMQTPAVQSAFEQVAQQRSAPQPLQRLPDGRVVPMPQQRPPSHEEIAAERARVAAQSMQPPPGSAAQQSPIQQAPASAIPSQDQMLQFQVIFLVSRASEGSDPNLYADVLEDVLKPAGVQTLLSLPDPVIWLAQYHQGVTQYRAWFDALILSLRHGPNDLPTDNVPRRSASDLYSNVDPQRNGGGTGYVEIDGGSGEAGQNFDESEKAG